MRLVAQVSEGDGVAAALGEEVAAEAEHVGLAARAAPRSEAAEDPAGFDEALGMRAVGVGVDVDGIEILASLERFCKRISDAGH